MNNVMLNGRYKVFLVEEDDDDRERVVSGLVEVVEIVSEPTYGNVYSDITTAPIMTFLDSTETTLTLKLVPGTKLMFEDFTDEEEEE